MNMEFTQDIFEYFSEPKSRSNVWSRQRLEIKQGLIAFANSLYDGFQLRDMGLEITFSDHYPSLWNRKCVDRQWIFFSRGKEARKVVEDIIDVKRTLGSTITDPTPYFKNVFLALDLNAEAISMAVYLHWKAWVDRDNFLRRVEISSEREQWLGILKSLPDEYLLKVDGMDPSAAVEVDGEIMDRTIETYRSLMGFWSTGLFVPKDQILNLGGDIWEVLKVAFMLLMPLHEFMAWSPENDFISMSEKRKEAEEKKLQMARMHEKDVEAFRAIKEKEKIEQKQRHRELVEKQKDVQETVWVPRKEKERKEKVVKVEPKGGPVETKRREPERPAREEKEKEIRKKKLGRVEEVVAVEEEEEREFKYGDRVRIIEGMFKGKWGVVQEVDGRGSVKVILGPMVARLPLVEVRLLRKRI